MYLNKTCLKSFDLGDQGYFKKINREGKNIHGQSDRGFIT